jgi:hypothetical protein
VSADKIELAEVGFVVRLVCKAGVNEDGDISTMHVQGAEVQVLEGTASSLQLLAKRLAPQLVQTALNTALQNAQFKKQLVKEPRTLAKILLAATDDER